MGARVRTPISTYLTINGTEVDVSAAVQTGRVANGTSQANPGRAVVFSGRGRLVLVGATWAPGVSTVYTLEQLTARLPCRIAQGTVDLWEGFVERPDLDPRGGAHVTTYRMVGKVDQQLAKSLSYVNSVGWPSDDGWETVVGQIPLLLGSADVDTAWAPYSLDGRVGEFVSKIGVVTGRLPGEDRLGRVGLATYRQPGPLVRVNSSELLVSSVLSEHVTDVRNIIDFPFDPVAGNTTTAGAEGRVTIDTGSVATSYEVTIVVPQPSDPNTTFTDFRVSLGDAFILGLLEVSAEAAGNTPSSITISGVSLQEIDIRQWVSVSFVVVGGQYEVTFTVDDFLVTNNFRLVIPRTDGGSERVSNRTTMYNRAGLTLSGGTMVGDVIDHNPQGSGTYFDRFPLNSIRNIQLVARLTYTVTSTGLSQVDLQNPTSRAQWGDEELEFPLWVSHSGLQPGQPTRARIQADLDYLAEPRLYHDVTLPLWQETQARNELVGALDFGSYADLEVADSSRGISVDVDALVTRRTLRWGARIVPEVTVRCQQLGPPTPVAGPSVTFTAGIPTITAAGTAVTPSAPIVMATLAAFQAAFTGETTGSNNGRWRGVSTGSTFTANTGPGTNNTLGFVHTRAQNAGSVTQLESNGRATFAVVPAGMGRRLRLRVALFGSPACGVCRSMETEPR